MKEIKLHKNNGKKYCLCCKEIVQVKMIGLDGYCPLCLENRNVKVKLCTIDTRGGITKWMKKCLN